MKLNILNLMLVTGLLAGTVAHAESKYRITRYTNLSKEQVSRNSKGDLRIFQKDLDFQTRQAAKVCEMLHFPRVISDSPVRFANVRGLASSFESFAPLYKGMKPKITPDNLYVLKVTCEKTVDDGNDHHDSDHTRTPTPTPTPAPHEEPKGEQRPDAPAPETKAPATETNNDRTPEASGPTTSSASGGERTESETSR